MRSKQVAVSLLLISLFTGRSQAQTVRTWADTIHFGFNSSQLYASDIRRLDSLIKDIVSFGRITSVDIEAYCDNVGNDRYNDSLSDRRAASARTSLAGLGMPDSVFRSVKGFGRRKPLSNDDDAANRRAVILIRAEEAEPYIPPPPPAQPRPRERSPERFPTIAETLKDTTGMTGRDIILHFVNFMIDTHRPMPGTPQELDQLVKILKQYPAVHIEIRGHICCYFGGKDGYDRDTRTDDLSVQRARYVFEYLKEKGIKADRMTYCGFGSQFKLYPAEANARERLLNRRVEISIVPKN